MTTCYHGDPAVSTAATPEWLLSNFSNKIFRQLTDLDKHYDFEAQRPLLERFIARYLASLYMKELGLDGLPSEKRQTIEKELVEARLRQTSNRGRPPMDPVLMLKVVMLGVIHRLSDAQLAFDIADRSTFRSFLRLPPGVQISRSVIWKYREIFTETKLLEHLFSNHVHELTNEGILPGGDMIIDGSFVEARKQRNTRQENQMIKQGRGSELWLDEPNKRAQKDIDARWTKKNNETHFGYKVHAAIEESTKVIVHLHATPANVHDSQVISPLLSDEEDAGKRLLADSAYGGRPQIEEIESFGMIPEVCEKGTRGKPLTEEQKESNRIKSKTRCRIEHVFGYIQIVFGGSFVRSVGIKRATAYQWATALAYNIFRVATLKRQTV